MANLLLILVAGVAFAIGSVPFAFVAGRLFADIDIRRFGSGNPGASNTFRILGPGPGAAVLVMDALKGAAGVWLGLFFAQEQGTNTFVAYFATLTGLCAVLGHIWSPWLGFRGGKGVGPLLGVFAVLFPLGTLIAAVLSVSVVLVTKKFSLGSLTGATLLPILFVLLRDQPWSPEARPLLLLIGLAVVLVFVRHISNLKRLVAGQEHGLRR